MKIKLNVLRGEIEYHKRRKKTEEVEAREEDGALLQMEGGRRRWFEVR